MSATTTVRRQKLVGCAGIQGFKRGQSQTAFGDLIFFFASTKIHTPILKQQHHQEAVKIGTNLLS
jgi:hypothetical protein